VRNRYNSRRIQSVAPGTHCAIESAARINHLDSNGFADRVECAVIWSSLFVIVVFEGFRCRCHAGRIMPRWTERAAKTNGLFHRLVLPGNLRSVRAIIPKHLRVPRPTQERSREDQTRRRVCLLSHTIIPLVRTPGQRHLARFLGIALTAARGEH